jgi:hypothetical protein
MANESSGSSVLNAVGVHIVCLWSLVNLSLERGKLQGGL